VDFNWNLGTLLSQHPEAEARLHAEIDAAARAGSAGLAQMEALQYNPAGGERGAAAVSPGWLAVAPHHRGGRARRLPGAAGHQRAVAAVPVAPSTRGSGRSRRLSHRSASPPSTKPSVRALPTCPSPRPRHCIGETFALYRDAHCTCYKVARRYRLTWVPDKPLQLEAQINLRTRFRYT